VLCAWLEIMRIPEKNFSGKGTKGEIDDMAPGNAEFFSFGKARLLF
jgi:hypothetical protein